MSGREHAVHPVSCHAVHERDSYCLVGHFLHVLVHAVVLPIVVDHVPGVHGIQRAAPALDHVPAGHGLQLDELVAPMTLEDVPAGHKLH
jgi:hypothetical protein